MQSSIDLFHQNLLKLNPAVSDAEWDYLQSGFEIEIFKPRDFFIVAGKKNHRLGFLTSGLIRKFHFTELGDDVTTGFIKENEYAADYPSLLTGKPSRYNFQCLEATIVVSIPYEHLQAGYNKYYNFERNGRLIAEDLLKQQQKRIEGFQFDSAEKRYLDFMSENRDLFNRVSLKHLSSYLGIERPSLSRIRKKIAKG